MLGLALLGLPAAKAQTVVVEELSKTRLPARAARHRCRSRDPTIELIPQHLRRPATMRRGTATEYVGLGGPRGRLPGT
jgi:hypothetical protein